MGQHAGGGAEQGSSQEKKGAPSPLAGMCAAPTPTPGGPGAACSAILMLSAGPGCGKHPYATLLRGLRVASNHGHLLTWHRAQAQSLGNRARQRLVLRRAPQTGRGASSSGGPRGQPENKRQIFLSLNNNNEDRFHLRLSTKRGTGRGRGGEAERAPTRSWVLGTGGGDEGVSMFKTSSQVAVSSWRQPLSAVPRGSAAAGPQGQRERLRRALDRESTSWALRELCDCGQSPTKQR